MSHSKGNGDTPLSWSRVLQCALDMADAEGLSGVTIRSLALHTKPMSLYYYVTNKDEILNGLVDLVFGEVELPMQGGDWRTRCTGGQFPSAGP